MFQAWRGGRQCKYDEGCLALHLVALERRCILLKTEGGEPSAHVLHAPHERVLRQAELT